MQCIVPTCYNDDDSCISQGITFHIFPTDSTQCLAWLKALNMEDLKPLESSVICSNHFIKNDLYIARNGQRMVHANAVPIVNLLNIPNDDFCMTPCDAKVCRICLATDCNLYQMTMCNKLHQAYETLTELSIDVDDNLPSYLCAECAQRLLNCIHFRTRSLRAHLILLETIKKHDQITLETLKSTCGNLDLFKSNLSVKHNPIDHFDLEIDHINNDNIENKEKDGQTDTNDAINLEADVLCKIKLENDETSNQGNRDTAAENIETGEEANIINAISVESDLKHRMMLESDGICNHDNSRTIMLRFNEDSFNNDSTSKETMYNDTVIGERYFLGDKLLGSREQTINHNERKIKHEKCVSNHLSTGRNDNCLNKLPDANQLIHNNLCELSSSEVKKSKSLSHLNTHAKSNIFFCDICNYKTNDIRRLKIHKKLHSDKKKYSCTLCEKIFNIKGNLKRHMIIHSGEKPFSCDICSKTFNRQDHYKNHMKMHSNEKPYSCHVCKKVFSRKDHYKTHLKSHSNKELCYACDVCKKMFGRKSNLQNHMNLHSGEKPYSCKVCKKTFRRSNNLRKHSKLHGKKPYSCDMCWKCFSRKSELRIHIQLHSVARPYTCNECKKVFTTKNGLRIHLRKYCVE